MKERNKATVLKADGTMFENIEPNDGHKFTLAELQGMVGGYIEIGARTGEETLICNEEGKLNGLPFNAEATAMLQRMTGGTDGCVVGDAVLCPNDLID